MVWLLVPLVAVAVPAAVERFYFRKKFGPFTLLLLVFLVQLGLLVGGEFLLGSGIDAPDMVASFFTVLAAIAYLTIGFAPIASIGLSALVLILIVAEKIWPEAKDA